MVRKMFDGHDDGDEEEEDHCDEDGGDDDGVREAIGYQIGCFFTHCGKGGGGVEPMCKNLCCKFV